MKTLQETNVFRMLHADIKRSPIRVIFYFIIAVFSTAPQVLAQVPGYTYRVKVTIDGSQVCGAGNLIDFPILIQHTAPFLRPAPAGLVNNTNGYDVVFTASDGSTLLSHQVDHFTHNATNGTYAAWVRIPSLSPSVNTDIYMYYGNSSVVTDQSSTSTWNANYSTVYHLQSSSLNDGTTNNINGTNNGTLDAGTAQIGGGREFDGADDYIQTTSNDLVTANSFTVSGWFKTDNTSPSHILWQGMTGENGWGDGQPTPQGQEFHLSLGTCCASVGGYVSTFLGHTEEQLDGDGLTAEVVFTNTTDWHYIVATMSNLSTAPIAELYVDGTLADTDNGITTAFDRSLWDNNLLIGKPGANQRYFDGQLDEIRISTLSNTADWICTEYNNQSNPGSGITLTNDAPDLANIEGTSVSYTEEDPAKLITSTITVADENDGYLTGATIQITGNHQSGEDVLTFTNAFGITGVWNPGTGILILSGNATIANYQAALRSVTYQNNNNNNPNPLSRTVSFTVNDGIDSSSPATRNITIIPVNDVPVLAAIEVATLAYSEDQPVTSITSTLSITDVDNTTINSATVQITTNYNSAQDVLAFTSAFGITAAFNSGSGLLTLSGVASIADYTTALRSVTYLNTNTISPSTAVRTVTLRVNDGTANSNTVTRTITVTTVNDPPVLASIEAAALSYNEGPAATVITAAINVTDVDNSNLTSAIVQVTGNYLSTEDVLSFTNAFGITGSFDVPSGTMILTGTTTLANYRSALRSIRYQNTNTNNPSGLQRTISFIVNDGTNDSNIAARAINVNPINDASALASIEPATLNYTEDDGPVAITSTLTITDVDNTTLASATVQITGSYNSSQDRLAFTDAFGITGTFNTSNGLLTLTGSALIGDYETAIRSVTYENINTINPSTTVRTVTFRVNDGAANSNTQTRTITISLVNDAPILAAMESTDMIYLEGQAATAVTATTTVTDGDNAQLAGATIQITTNIIPAEDILSFTNANGITGSWDAVTSTMTLTGNASITNYRNAIRGVRYRNSNNATPSPLTRTVSYIVTDGALSSNIVTRDIIVTPVNDVPVAANDAVTTDEETDVLIVILSNDTDIDDAIDPTTIVIVTPPANGTVTVDQITGEVTYSPDFNFSGSNTFYYTVNDASGGTSNSGRVTITVNNINDMPYFTKGPDIIVIEDAGTQTVTGWATGINDGDPFTNQSLTFVLSNDNTSLFGSQPSVNSAGNLSFRSATNRSGTATVTIFLRDNGSSTLPHVNQSGTQTFTITVLSENDPPDAVDDFYSTSSNTPLTASLQSNDRDPESNTIIVNTTTVVAPVSGSVIIYPNGTFTYTPDGNFTGTDTFTYEICDDGNDNGVPASRCDQAVVSITINPPNDYYNIVGNNSIEISTHCFILTKALNNQQGAVWRREPLDLRYSFDLNFDAMFSDSSVVRDGGADGIIFLLQRDDTPPPLNVPGSPIDARGSVGEYLGVGGITPSIGIEVDTYQNSGEPAFDHIAISRDGSVYNIISPAVPAKVNPTDTLNIEDGLTHTVQISWDKPTETLHVFFDGEERTSYTGDVINTIFGGDPTNIYWGFSASTGGQNNYQGVCGIDMQIINLPPVVTNETATTNEDTAVNGSVLANDVDPEDGSLSVVAETKATTHGQVIINQDGTYTYTPTPDYFGTDQFTYQVCDSYTSPGCSQGMVTITVNSINDAPVAVDDNVTTAEENVLSINVVTNDVDVDNLIVPSTIAIVTDPVRGALSIDGITGLITYTPITDFYGSDQFSYTIKDEDGATSNVAIVIIQVTPVNDAPVAIDDLGTTRQIALTLRILDNDTDIDNAIDLASIVISLQPSNGTVTLDNSTGIITYIPDQDYLGSDTFTYSVSDAEGASSNEAVVVIQVTPANRPPVANDDGPETFSLLRPITIDVLANDSDPDHAQNELTIITVSNSTYGTIAIENGMIIFSPFDLTESVLITFTYTIQDPDGLTDEGTVTLQFEYKPLAISEGFSPNGDGNNDQWYIRSIENFPNNNIRIYNRWGLLVYQTNNYDNASTFWDGRANTGQQSGNYVDQGTYYYAINLGNNEKELSGYLVILR